MCPCYLYARQLTLKTVATAIDAAFAFVTVRSKGVDAIASPHRRREHRRENRPTPADRPDPQRMVPIAELPVPPFDIRGRDRRYPSPTKMWEHTTVEPVAIPDTRRRGQIPSRCIPPLIRELPHRQRTRRARPAVLHIHDELRVGLRRFPTGHARQRAAPVLVASGPITTRIHDQLIADCAVLRLACPHRHPGASFPAVPCHGPCHDVSRGYERGQSRVNARL